MDIPAGEDDQLFKRRYAPKITELSVSGPTPLTLLPNTADCLLEAPNTS
jgi:hypothetical protein